MLPLPARDWPIPPMDKAAGYKPSAFTWAMGHLILQRMGDRETMKAITADPAMPAYCTVFRWVKMVPEFGEAYRQVRLAISQVAREEAAAKRAEKARAHAAARMAAGKRVRHWVAGRPSSYTDEMAETVCAAIEAGASMTEVVRTPGMPSFKVVYTWMRRRPAFQAMYVEACRRRAVGFEIERDMVIEKALLGVPLPALNRELAAIEGRAGRLTPKLHRPER
jgi:hypothetical protein